METEIDLIRPIQTTARAMPPSTTSHNSDNSADEWIRPTDRVYYGGCGADEDANPENERTFNPNTEASLLGTTQYDDLCDAVVRERVIKCGCSPERRLHCTCTNMYMEVAPRTSGTMQHGFKAILKQYAKDDPSRKNCTQVHAHLSVEHARDRPLREWGVHPEPRLLAMAFPHLFPFGLTSFVEPLRYIPWTEDEFNKWLAHLPFIHYTVVHRYETSPMDRNTRTHFDNMFMAPLTYCYRRHTHETIPT